MITIPKLAALLIMASVSHLHAFVDYTLQNLNAAGTEVVGGIADNAGTLLVDGGGSIVSFGTFTGGDTDVTSATSSSELFDTYTEIDAGSFSSGFGNGILQITLRDNSFTTTGDTIYTVLGNASTLGASTQFLVYKHDGRVFVPAPSTEDALLISSGAEVLIGGYGNFSHDFGAGNVSAFNLDIIPEPSSTALLGLGGMVLLLRRRK